MPMLKISHREMQKIFDLWQLPPPIQPVVLFAFRGSLPVVRYLEWKGTIALETAKLDYRHMRCTIGIWNTKAEKILAFPGSTVPFRDRVYEAMLKNGAGANQMEPGYYTDFTKGEHLQGRINGHEALRQTAFRFYRRTVKGIPYSPGDPLYFGNPYDNLHCGWNSDGVEPGYSSAGCIVVAGTPSCKRHERPMPNGGPWKIFHSAIYGSRLKTFPLLLLPAKEVTAALHAAVNGRNTVRLCFGSEGQAVANLQKRLKAAGHYKGRITGRLDARTYRAWNLGGLQTIPA